MRPYNVEDVSEKAQNPFHSANWIHASHANAYPRHHATIADTMPQLRFVEPALKRGVITVLPEYDYQNNTRQYSPVVLENWNKSGFVQPSIPRPPVVMRYTA